MHHNVQLGPCNPPHLQTYIFQTNQLLVCSCHGRGDVATATIRRAEQLHGPALTLLRPGSEEARRVRRSRRDGPGGYRKQAFPIGGWWPLGVMKVHAAE